MPLNSLIRTQTSEMCFEMERLKWTTAIVKIKTFQRAERTPMPVRSTTALESSIRLQIANDNELNDSCDIFRTLLIVQLLDFRFFFKSSSENVASHTQEVTEWEQYIQYSKCILVGCCNLSHTDSFAYYKIRTWWTVGQCLKCSNYTMNFVWCVHLDSLVVQVSFKHSQIHTHNITTNS